MWCNKKEELVHGYQQNDMKAIDEKGDYLDRNNQARNGP